VKVSVPFSGTTLYGNETLVTFTNAVNTGQFKICKTSSSSLVADESFVFHWDYFLNSATATTGTITLKPGQCGWKDGSGQGLSPAIPVVDNNGAPVTVYVYGDTDTGTWMLNHQYYISSISHTGSGAFAENPANGDSGFIIGQGVNSVTYDNEPCASNGCTALPAPTVTPTTVAAGDAVTVAGTGCVPSGGPATAIVMLLDSSGQSIAAETALPDSSGAWSVTVVVPIDTPAGSYTVAASCDQYFTQETYPAVTLTVV
jgi:hypothetical protein